LMAVRLFSLPNYAGATVSISTSGAYALVPGLPSIGSVQVDPGFRLTVYPPAGSGSSPIIFDNEMPSVPSPWSSYSSIAVSVPAMTTGATAPPGYSYTQSYPGQPPSGRDTFGRPLFQSGVQLFNRTRYRRRPQQQTSGGGLLDFLLLSSLFNR
jgi:hypothetical protein